MAYHLLVTLERNAKTQRIMNYVRGSLDAHAGFTYDVPKQVSDQFVIWGHLFNGERATPAAWDAGTPFYFIDNGYMDPANGGASGYYAITYRSFSPMLLDDPDMSRLPIEFKDWQDPAQKPDGTVLLCMPGPSFGKMFRWDIPQWGRDIVERLKQVTEREIVVRDKSATHPLAEDLKRAAVVITHSSKSTVQAIREGIPCIVEPLSPCAPVAGNDLAQIETPPMPDRKKWWASLMCQQWSPDELTRGAARHWLAVAAQQGERIYKAGRPELSTLLTRPLGYRPVPVDDMVRIPLSPTPPMAGEFKGWEEREAQLLKERDTLAARVTELEAKLSAVEHKQDSPAARRGKALGREKAKGRAR
jgi:hypothetical protein